MRVHVCVTDRDFTSAPLFPISSIFTYTSIFPHPSLPSFIPSSSRLLPPCLLFFPSHHSPSSPPLSLPPLFLTPLTFSSPPFLSSSLPYPPPFLILIFFLFLLPLHSSSPSLPLPLLPLLDGWCDRRRSKCVLSMYRTRNIN